MGGNGSTRRVSFGLDEHEKVTLVEGVKLSEDVLRRMRESPGSDSAKTPAKASATEVQEEIRKNFERQQALVQEQLARLAQKEREMETGAPAGELSPALLMERGKAHEEQEKAKMLKKQLMRKEKELAAISSFYKEQLEILEKKNLDSYQRTSERYDQAAAAAEASIRPRQMAAVCSALQDEVLRCYRGNPQQTLRCSGLARQYESCVQQAKQSSLTNHG